MVLDVVVVVVGVEVIVVLEVVVVLGQPLGGSCEQHQACLPLSHQRRQFEKPAEQSKPTPPVREACIEARPSARERTVARAEESSEATGAPRLL